MKVFLKFLVSWEPFGNKNYRLIYIEKGKSKDVMVKMEIN